MIQQNLKILWLAAVALTNAGMAAPATTEAPVFAGTCEYASAWAAPYARPFNLDGQVNQFFSYSEVGILMQATLRQERPEPTEPLVWTARLTISGGHEDPIEDVVLDPATGTRLGVLRNLGFGRWAYCEGEVSEQLPTTTISLSAQQPTAIDLDVPRIVFGVTLPAQFICGITITFSPVPEPAPLAGVAGQLASSFLNESLELTPTPTGELHLTYPDHLRSWWAFQDIRTSGEVTLREAFSDLYPPGTAFTAELIAFDCDL